MKLFRRFLILAHRYLGIALSLLAVMWFATGIAMMYAGGMPRLTPEARLDRLASLDLSRVRLTPAEASQRAGGPAGDGGRVRLLTVLNRPAYRVGGAIVFADTGDLLEEVSVDQARAISSHFVRLPEDRIVHAGTLTETDQWTLGQNRALPLYKFRVDDEDQTEVYVQAQTGDVTMMTTRRSRMLAWISTIPHWLYFAALRENQRLWYRIIVWTSGALCVLGVLGLSLAVTQLKRTRPFNLSKAIPYSGWMRWHYITGAIFGAFTLTWAFSGLLSMEPFAWTNASGLEVPREALTGGPVDLSRFTTLSAETWNRALNGRPIKEIEFVRIQDEPYYLVRHASESSDAWKRERLHQPYPVSGRAEPDRVLVAAATLEIRRASFSTESLIERLRNGLPGVPIIGAELLSDYDSYYYSRGRQTPLPVLRVKFGDPAKTWVYVDPEMSQVLAEIHRLNRLERWLYNGLHSLDFSFWYNRRPLWDIGMIALLVGGLASSGIGMFLGIKRVWRGVVSVANGWSRTPVRSPADPSISRSALTR